MPANAPPVKITQADVDHWFDLNTKISKMKTEEMELRKKICSAVFPNPKEGTNKHNLPDGWVMKMQHVVNRKVDEAVLAANKERFLKAGIPVDQIIRWKPDLKVGDFKKLDEAKQVLLGEALIITDGSPQLEIVLPKRGQR